MVLRCWYTGVVQKSDIHFHNSSHLSKQVSNSANLFTVTGTHKKHKHKYARIILVLLQLHQPFCALMASEIVYIC